ncbi:hypothetical protein BDZ94DRAFT_1325802 [Collybia nuda]|uniref:Uncharacterized protein n=1 Tax=Collybia nuda TaxID=64659 RepID=A0A9P6CA87_9AGAR|nr:hypothetical protein BDZ94DRAFT_1325802 [Collybia nuda]
MFAQYYQYCHPAHSDYQLLKRRRTIFKKYSLPTELEDARITEVAPLRLASWENGSGYGFVVFDKQIMLAKVMSIYSKSAGRAGKHGLIPQASSIAAVSNIPVQLFEHMIGSQFRANHAAQRLHIKKYCLLPSSAFLSTLDTAPFASGAGLKISQQDWLFFKALKDKLKDIMKAVSTLGGRKKKNVAIPSENEDEE